MRVFSIVVLLVTGNAALAQQNFVGSIYLAPLPGRAAVTSQQVIMPRLGEIQIIGSPHAPASVIQLIGYSGSWQEGAFKGPLGVYGEYQISGKGLVSIGTYTFLKGELFGGKLAGPYYLGYKPAGGPLEFNAPHSRLVWPVAKELGAGLGWAINARSGKPTTFQIGPLLEWKRGELCTRVRLGQILTGPLHGNTQVRMEVFQAF